MKILLCLALLGTTACSSLPKSGAPTNKAIAALPQTPAPQGRLDRVRFFADGNRLLWMISREAEYGGAQIYESDLLQEKFRRVTWQDGEVESFDVSDNDKLVYASTTDEIKEHPHPTERPAEQGLPSEIYLSDRYGDEIRRLTTHPGFDGQVSISPKGHDIAYVTKDGAKFTVHKVHMTDPLSPQTIANLGETYRYSPVISEDGKVAWLERKTPNGPADLRIENRKSPLRTLEPAPIALRRAPQPGWFYWEKSAEAFRIVYLNADGTCRKTLYESKDGIVWVDLSPSPYRIAMIVEAGGGTKLVLKDLPANAFACESQSNAAIMTP